MAEPEVFIDGDGPAGDEEMGEAGGINGTAETANEEVSGIEYIQPDLPERTAFLDYLRSPIVQLVLGSGAAANTLSAHQGLLVRSPFFAEACARFSESSRSRKIDLPSDDIEACAAVLEWLYKDDYFPSLSTSQSLEPDPTVPEPDNDGIALLRHARVYTLAQKWSLPVLASLARKKIHLTDSTATGEIAYARFIYKETSPDDASIRKPVAQFWATRSHILRHEAEQEFKRMCLEYPQFGFDVLQLVLDAQEKRSQRQDVASAVPGSGRKRQRVGGTLVQP